MCYIRSDPKTLKPLFKTEVEVKSDEKKSIVSKVNPSLYKKLIIEDLTSIGMHLLIIFFTWQFFINNVILITYKFNHSKFVILVGPSEKYWEVIAERRRKALEDVLEQNRKLHAIVIALEEENASCKKLLEQTTDLVNTLKVYMKLFIH